MTVSFVFLKLTNKDKPAALTSYEHLGVRLCSCEVKHNGDMGVGPVCLLMGGGIYGLMALTYMQYTR